MAKQIEDIVVQLGIQGFEELNKLRSSFRELTKVTRGTDDQLNAARKRLLELKTELGDTARANKGLTDAFTALVGEARRGSDVWQSLNKDLAQLRQESRLTDTQITALRDIIVDESKAHAQSAVSIREHVKSLQDLRNQATLNGKVHQQLGADIQRLTATLEQGEITNRKHYSSLTAMLAVKPDKVLKQWEDYNRILKEGTASADKLATAQRRLNQLSGAPRILERRRVSESAAITQDPEYLRRFGFEGASLPELPNTNAAYAQQIKELQQDLANLDRNSIEYLQTLMQLTGVQRQSTEVARGYAQALLMGVQTKTVANSTRNLQEVVTALRAEMQQLDTTTSEGSAAYAQNANQVRVLEKQLNDLAGAYRNVSTMATQAATAEQNAANKRIRDNYFNRAAVARQEQAIEELGRRVREGVANTPLLLPAAGQTSAAGTGAAISGGARRLVPGRTEVTFGPSEGQAPTRGSRAFLDERAVLRGGDLPSAAVGVSPALGGQLAAQFDNLGKSAERARRPLRDIYVDIDKTTKASNGSVNSLEAQIGAWTELRNAVGRTAPAFDTATKKLEQLTARRERLTGGRRLSGMQLAQGVGAALSGGIFGGPEGLIGGLGGLAVGGVGGAFAGAAAGAQVGMFRQQLSGVTDYSARIDKLQIALRGILGSQDAYTRALAAADSATRDLNIPQEIAIRSMTQLSAAVTGAGGTVTDSAFAFRAVSEAVKATGGNAEQADGALLALTQVFSKGKVSAEELNQIAERLPGTFVLFAKAAGMTGPQLQKALQEGQVGLNDLMKFLQLISTEYGQTALKIAKSSQEAGARLTVAMQNMQLEVGRALQPLGADLQNAFAIFITDITPAVVAAAQGFVGVAKAIGAAGDAFMDFTAPVRDFFATGMPAYLQVAKAFWDSIANDVSAFWTRIGSFFTGLQTISSTALKAIGIDVGGLGDTMQIVATNVGKFWSSIFDFIKGRWRETVSNMINYSNPLLAGLKLLGIADVGQAVTKGIAAGATAMSPIFKLPQAQQSTAESPSVFPSPATDEEKKKKAAKDKAERERQAAAAEQQRLANTLLDQQLRAADRVFQHQIELDRQRYELQKRLDDAQAQNRIMRETGAARDIVSNFEDLQRSLREIEERRVRAVQDVRLAKQTQQSAAVRATFADQGAAALSAGGTGISATAIAKATAEAAKFTGIANQCSEAVKSFYKSLGITLPGVTAWADTVRNAGTVMRDWSKLRPGDIVATGRPGDTPHVGVYTGGNNVFHQSRKRGLTAGNYPDLDYFKSGYFVRPTQSAGTARMPTGAAAQQNRAIRASGGAVIEGLDVNKAEAQLQLIEANVSKERATLFEQFTLKATDALRQQNATMRDSNELQTLRNRLTLEGVRPEFVDLEERLLGIRQEQNQAQTTYNQLVKANPDRAAELQSVLAAQNEQYAERARLLRENAEAAEAFNKAMRTRQDERIGLGLREGAEAYVQSIGTMREATAQLAQTGIKGVEDAIFSLVTTGTANFQEFAASILRDTARMIIQQMVLRSIMQIIGAIAPGGSPASALVPGMPFNPASIPGMAFGYGGVFAKNNVVPFAMGGIVDKPTLFPFANGGAGRLGLMGEAGPEAIMPLRRLPSGRLGVEAGGAGTGVVVNVNVDAKGTAVESDQSNGQALGAVVGAAVRAEIVQQQRPGGLLDSSRRR
jgi:lambda family phage tail tape measure protein